MLFLRECYVYILQKYDTPVIIMIPPFLVQKLCQLYEQYTDFTKFIQIT